MPEIASRMHAQAISGVVKKAMDDAGVDYSGIDAIAVTYAPGLIGTLETRRLTETVGVTVWFATTSHSCLPTIKKRL